MVGFRETNIQVFIDIPTEVLVNVFGVMFHGFTVIGIGGDTLLLEHQ